MNDNDLPDVLKEIMLECLEIDPSTLTEQERLRLFVNKIVLKCARTVRRWDYYADDADPLYEAARTLTDLFHVFPVDKSV